MMWLDREKNMLYLGYQMTEAANGVSKMPETYKRSSVTHFGLFVRWIFISAV
jgi:hypothetical protein